MLSNEISIRYENISKRLKKSYYNVLLFKKTFKKAIHQFFIVIILLRQFFSNLSLILYEFG